MSKLSDIISKINLEELKNDYLDSMSKHDITIKYNICLSTLNKILSELEVIRDINAVRSQKISNTKNKRYEEIKKNITKDILYKYYILEDNDYYKTLKHFNLTDWTFNKLLDDYDIKKDRSKSFEKGKQKRIERYGVLNQTNWKKGHETRINHYGSIEESYKEGYKKQIETMRSKYGITCALLFNDNSKSSREHSNPNDKFAKLLSDSNIVFEREFKLENKCFDFKVGDILIEINPYITHNVTFNPFNKANNYEGISKNYHKEKTLLASKNGYRCLHVWDWDDIEKIIKLLKPRDTVYARKCIIKEVDSSDAKIFINKYHLQGYARSKIKIGLYYNDELVAIMTFSKPRYNKNYEYELIRYCSSKNIIGGEEKLFKYFIDTYNPTSIISYCDNAKFAGKIYLKLGFNKISIGTPTRHWINKKLDHYTDGFIRAQGFSRVIHGCSAEEDNLDTNNNDVLMLRDGFFEIYDCGQSVYSYTRN